MYLYLIAGNALDDLCLDFDISSIDRELDRDNDTNSVSSSLSAGLSASGNKAAGMNKLLFSQYSGCVDK